MDTLGLSMIIRDEPIDRLVMLIDYLKPIVSQVSITDTGTREPYREYQEPYLRAAGVRLNHIEWPDDFSKARNDTLDRLDTEWVLHLDADELPSRLMVNVIENLLVSAPRHVMAARFFTRNYWGGELGIEVNAHWHVRMFRREHGWWYKPLHEQVMIDGRKEGGYTGTKTCFEAPKEAYLIHSKPAERIESSMELYRSMGHKEGE